MDHTKGKLVSTKGALIAGAAIVAVAATACGGSSSAKTSSPTAPAPTAAASGTPGRGGFDNRTPRPDLQTSIAEGTPFAGPVNRTQSPEVQTSIAEGTPFAGFGNRTPSPDLQTAIAEGTPFRGAGAFGGGRRTVTEVAAILGIDETQLQSELQQPGATIATVAAAHGKDRATIRQALIDAATQRLADMVTSGGITQAMADDQTNVFEARVDELLDSTGTGPPPAAP